MKQPFNPVHPDPSQPDQPLADEHALLEHYRQHTRSQPTPAMDALILAAAAAQLTRPKPALLSGLQRFRRWLSASGDSLRWSVALASLSSIGLGLMLSLHSFDQLPPAYDLGEPLPSVTATQESAQAPQIMSNAEVQMAPASAPMTSAPITHESMANKSMTSAPSAVALVEPLAANKAESSAAAPVLQQSQAELKSAPLLAPARLAATKDKAAAQLHDQALVASEQALGEVQRSRQQQAKKSAADAATERAAAGYAEDSQPQAAPLAKAKSVLEVTFAEQLQVLLALQRSGANGAAALELQRLQQLYPERDVAAELAKLQADAP